jgi:TfoX/Sxy family transcriptional regulator of competence genes
MGFDEKLNNRIREALVNVHELEEKQMFGGICYMVNKKMCIGVVNDDMMCRIGPEAYESALEKTGCREMTFTGKPMIGYVFVGQEGLRTQEDLKYWIDLCLAFNPNAKSSRKMAKQQSGDQEKRTSLRIKASRAARK